jgi:hypothetical protein
VRVMAARLGDKAHNLSVRLYRIRKQLARCVELSMATEER